MAGCRTRYYLDKQNGRWLGVCAGFADYTGFDVMWVRIATILFTLMGGFPWTLITYWLIAWMAQPKPIGLYSNDEDARFWQRVRSNPARSTREVKSKFRDIDRRLANIEAFYTSRNTRLADEIESLR